LLVVALHNAALLHKEGIARPRARKLSEKDLLGTAVGLADVIAGPLERDQEILHLAKITSERTPGLHRGLDHDIDDGRERHWIMSSERCCAVSRRGADRLSRPYRRRSFRPR